MPEEGMVHEERRGTLVVPRRHGGGGGALAGGVRAGGPFGLSNPFGGDDHANGGLGLDIPAGPSQVQAAVVGLTLATSTLNVTYTRR